MPDIFPKYRHIVVNGTRRFPTRITAETNLIFETEVGKFFKNSRQKLGDPKVTFEGPFTAEGKLE